jgi:RNA polymerase sigma-70 factor (ECF subfamily)
MAGGQSITVRQFLRSLALARGVAAFADETLLKQFLNERDETAFAALVHRHGPMVFRVCRSILHNPDDALDAFQAAFLVLARQARSINRRASLGSWLHGVAYRVAVRAKAAAARRRLHEREVVRESYGKYIVVMAVAFSPDGATLAIGDGKNNVRLWDVAKRKERASFSVAGTDRPSRIIESLAFARGGKTLAVGYERVKLFDVSTLEESADFTIGDGTKLKLDEEGRRVIEGPPAVAKVAFSTDGKTLVGTGWVGKKEKTQGFVRVWRFKEPSAPKKDSKGPAAAPASAAP